MSAPAIHYREQANTWQERAANLPPDHPQRGIYREIADGCEKLAVHYERERREAEEKHLS
jgi:hypothetical protein